MSNICQHFLIVSSHILLRQRPGDARTPSIVAASEEGGREPTVDERRVLGAYDNR